MMPFLPANRGILANVSAMSFLILMLILMDPFEALADWSGRVVWVQDGDSLIILQGGEKRTIRLQGIDSPEKGQPFAREATQTAIQLAKNRQVTVKEKEKDRYSRIVAQVFLPDGRNLSHVMVEKGMAWRHIYYAKDPRLITLERQARQARLGLWADKAPMPPWVYKKNRHQVKRQEKP